ncbi:hypothetical protein Hdeb2414_s0018g00539261 [Helianthus debilis subsp. tardiflorus]
MATKATMVQYRMGLRSWQILWKKKVAKRGLEASSTIYSVYIRTVNNHNSANYKYSRDRRRNARHLAPS